MAETARKTVYTIPAGAAFSDLLAKNLLETYKDKPEQLAQVRILLPTRRAFRVVRDSFVKLSGGGFLVLPHMQPLGDIDEEELSISIAGHEELEKYLDMPKPVSSLKRQIMLTRLIMARPDFTQGFDHALALSAALGRFIDQVYTEDLKMENLQDLVPEEFAQHWGITLNFLNIIGQNWPKILGEEKAIDASDRRNRLLKALALYWNINPPDYPVMAAGSTGSIPAVADLLKVVAGLPQGSVILPGLDTHIDQESWDTLDETHPQFGFRQLLDHMNLSRHNVQSWPDMPDDPAEHARRNLVSELMRPANTSNAWSGLKDKKDLASSLPKSLKNLRLIECQNNREESAVNAILFRETLEAPGKTAALITPDRDLARHVQASCARWGIALDDSAGRALSVTSLGSFCKIAILTCLHRLAPASLLALLKHGFCHLGMDTKIYAEALETLELEALRGPRPAPGFEGLYDRLAEQGHENTDIIRHLSQAIAPLMKMAGGGPYSFGDFLKTHIQSLESLAKTPDQKGAEILWLGEDGEKASVFFSELMEQAALFPEMDMATYHDTLERLMQSVTVRPAYGTHPRLNIFGQLEARLIHADLVIMAGLNEGSWPAAPGHDPWMSRPMRTKFGLPSYERSIGLAAHDFAQGFCMPNVVMTRSKQSGGAPTVPARWLQRLETVLNIAGIKIDMIEDHQYKNWAEQLDAPDDIIPCTRPAPKPPVSTRPRRISASRIETWMKDPYGLYARDVLNLKKLDPVEQPVDAAVRGTLLHKILQRFIAAYPADLPANAENILYDLAKKEIEKRHDDPAVWNFWWPRFHRLSGWFTEHEKNWRRSHMPFKTEIRGEIFFDSPAGKFTLSAKADRLDKGADGIAVIDYKSGGQYSKTQIISGEMPQLGAEALIVSHGGFPETGSADISGLHYWILTGGSEAGKTVSIESGIDQILSDTEAGLKNLVAVFDEENTPYYSIPDSENAPRFNDYEHLARVKEWSISGDSDAVAEDF